MQSPRIVSIEWGRLEGQRPRHAGKNARLNEHGKLVHVPTMRLKTEDGSSGFGVSVAERDLASTLLGKQLNEVFIADRGTAEPWMAFDYPLWDLMGQRVGLPVYALAAAAGGATVPGPFRVRCYDTSLYMDDLHLPTDQQAAQLLAAEALEAHRRGHRAFKIKVGRGARHIPLEEGTKRDIAVIHGVREAVGPACTIMIDANNGYNLNLTKRVLAETAADHIFWIEEPFHEDDVLYRDLHTWLAEQNLPILISEGEGRADPALLEWARQGLVDVIQYDVIQHGFTHWLATGRQLDDWGKRCAPHHYGFHYGNYVTGHLAGAIRGFVFVEWDEATTPGLDTSDYTLSEGWISIPDTPGFGLKLDEAIFQRAVAETGFSLTF